MSCQKICQHVHFSTSSYFLGTQIPDEPKYGEEAAREYVQHLSDDLKRKFGHVLEDFEQEMAKALIYFGSK